MLKAQTVLLPKKSITEKLAELDSPDEKTVVALILSEYGEDFKEKEYYLDVFNLQILNSVELSDEAYSRTLYYLFIESYVGVDVIHDATALDCCKRAFKYFEDSKQLHYAARCAQVIGFYHESTGQGIIASRHYRKALTYYDSVGAEEKVHYILPDYAACANSHAVSVPLYKGVLYRGLRKQDKNLDIAFYLDELADTTIAGLSDVYRALLNLFDKEEGADSQPSESITILNKVLNTELYTIDKPYSLFDKIDLSIIVNVIDKLDPAIKEQLAAIKTTIVAKITEPIPSLRSMVINFLLRPNPQNSNAQNSEHLVVIPKAQLRFFEDQQKLLAQLRGEQRLPAKSKEKIRHERDDEGESAASSRKLRRSPRLAKKLGTGST